MRAPLPPLQPVPHLQRLLAPEETIIYTAKLHPLFGWPWLLGGVLLVGLSLWWGIFLGLGLMVLLVYALPFKTNEIAVTTHRLLLRVGLFQLRTEGIGSVQLEEWQLRQNLLQALLHTGCVTIKVKEGRDLRTVVLNKLWHPMTFVEALETLQP
ncbi:MAG: hypothetical protein EBQ80_00160, partial [Proteobacteria bacterium]|nr:hypothetical protein [Pseudomonadota bacterium]